MDNSTYESPADQEIPEAEKVPLTPRAERAARELGLEPEHVLSFKESPDRIGFVTHGGIKLSWPRDTRKPNADTPSRASMLTESDKDGISRKAPKARA